MTSKCVSSPLISVRDKKLIFSPQYKPEMKIYLILELEHLNCSDY